MNLQVNDRVVYREKSTNEKGTVVNVYADSSFKVWFDRSFSNGLSGPDNRYFTFSQYRCSSITLLNEKFRIDDVVKILTGRYKNRISSIYALDSDAYMVNIDHDAVHYLANDLELVSRKQLI